MDAPLPPEVLRAITTGFSHLVANKYHVLASTVMLVYDHALTLEQERIHVWNKKKTLPSYLFFIFRYLTPVVSLINLIALHDPGWIGPICNHWIWLPVAVGPIVSAATGVILILRVYAIYQQSQWILYLTVPIYLAELGVMAWSIPAGAPAPLPPGFVGCVPSERAGTGRRLSALYIAALAFDATIFILTFGRAIYLHFKKSTIPLVTVIVRDGTLYFLVIFVVNVVNVILLTVATPDLSAINAPFASMITALLVARLMLNLREAGSRSLILSKNSRARGPNIQSRSLGTWRAAEHTGASSMYADTIYLDTFSEYPIHLHAKSEGTVSGGVVSFIGFEEFDFALGGDADSGQGSTGLGVEESSSSVGGNGEGQQGDDHTGDSYKLQKLSGSNC